MRRRDMVIFDSEAPAAARVTRAMTRAELQTLAGLSKRTVWKAHNGRPISLHAAKAIAKAVRRPLRKLLADSEGADGQRRAAAPGIKGFVGKVADPDQAAA